MGVHSRTPPPLLLPLPPLFVNFLLTEGGGEEGRGFPLPLGGEGLPPPREGGYEGSFSPLPPSPADLEKFFSGGGVQV